MPLPSLLPRRWLRAAAGLAALSLSARAADLPAYRDSRPAPIHGLVRIHSSELTQHLVHLWEDGFLKAQPLVRYSDYTVPAWFSGLSEGTAEIAVMGHEAWHSDLKAFTESHGYPPLEIMFATGGFDRRKGNTPGVIVFVNRDNPLTGLTLDQLDGILGAERSGGYDGLRWTTAAARGPEKNVRAWGQLGLGGEWAHHPIALHGIDATLSGWSGLIQRVVFKGGDKWNPAVHEWVRGGAEVPADASIVASVAQDRYALGFSFMRVVKTDPRVKALALSPGPGRPFVAPTEESFRQRTYPLVTAVYLYLNQPPGRALPPRLREFLRYVLSADGQRDVVEDGMYLPLTPEAAAGERAKLATKNAPPAPVRTPAESRLLRISGSPNLAGLLRGWEAGFRQQHPEACFEDRLSGSATGIFGLSENVADIALLGREMYTYETYGIYRRSLRLPVEFTVARGSVATLKKSPALAVFVNAANPLSHLSVRQLDGIFGAQRTGGWQGLYWKAEAARGAEADLREWGQAGLAGEWAGRAIHPCGPPGLYPGGVSFFQSRVMGGGDTWNEALREFAEPDALVAEVARDPLAIGYAPLAFARPGVKAIAISAAVDGPAVSLTAASVADGSYPLARSVYACIAPDSPVGDVQPPRPLVREFLQYVLSREGQSAVAPAAGFLPLTAPEADREAAKLAQPDSATP